MVNFLMALPVNWLDVLLINPVIPQNLVITRISSKPMQNVRWGWQKGDHPMHNLKVCSAWRKRSFNRHH